MSEPVSRVWVLPLGAEVLATDGRQAFYATEDGSGSVVDLGFVKSISIGTILPSDDGEPTCHCGRLAEDGDVICGQCVVRRYQSPDGTCCGDA